MIRPTEREVEVLCRICGEPIKGTIRRWVGIAPVCRACAERHADHMKFEDEEDGK